MSRNVLIVIPVLNEASHIETVVRNLAQDNLHEDRTIVVADGGSTDGTPDIVRQLANEIGGLHLLRNPQRLQSAGVNLAVQVYGAAAQVLVRCDAHCEYPADYVSRLLKTLDERQADSVVVPMDSRGDGCLQKAVAWVSDTKVGSGGSAHRGGKQSGFVDHGHHAAMTIDAFRRAGGYDETFAHNEDAEFDCRLRALGGRIFLDSDIRLSYRPRSSFLSLAKQYFNYGRGRSRTVRRHPGSLRLRQFLVPTHVALMLGAIVLAPAAPLLLTFPAVYLAILALTAMMIAVKHRSICGLLALPAAVVMHFAWALGFFWGILWIRQTTWQMTPSVS
ncbi:glycosyltransferase family 2 protein [Bradyrhizobium sp. 180]|uniref:glycosyltransferase family 2 protein n=1 Tax=unclassified Bradyrhizobium TaxID=2631580 RepID=UPI001FFBD25C|nr:glycosyltransferase family 2 protein [Bradyrhizobium sp. CW12]MCK1492964.1 glycosyltransferase family 2 protein [Bradyrhizobium sp. 180]MCK1531267.1 glycosyltransferase family 2 protein [Bradyrhizobium sp. 182]MCK1599130.1 glycosyltransferase family 2 protein [Bradyrhizobium sp. 164]MCK1645078.1 glycosyltransferase family 2 protein [Bradyrhizobium sp. 154]MCK1668208.1 glycosyltransferase family 2 protein [Bradyrhizobium sp. 153]